METRRRPLLHRSRRRTPRRGCLVAARRAYAAVPLPAAKVMATLLPNADRVGCPILSPPLRKGGSCRSQPEGCHNRSPERESPQNYFDWTSIGTKFQEL